ncbi:hypothetical protein C1646_677984, partial [Rhizophagus diaphanus]
TLARYVDAGPLTGIPYEFQDLGLHHNDIVAEFDNGMTAIFQQSLSGKQPIHFMPTEDPNEVLYQVSETTISPEPEGLSDTETENSEEDIPQFYIPLPPIYDTPNNLTLVVPPLEDFTRACNASNGIANVQKLEVVPAYLKGAAFTWWNANQALPNNNPNKIIAWADSTIAGSIGATRKYGRAAFKLRGVPQEGERTCQTTIPSNLTLLKIYPAMKTTQSKARLDPTTGTVKEKPLEEEMILLAMNPKFSLTVAKQLRKLVVRTKIEEQDKKPVKKDDKIPNDENISEVEDLMQVANTARLNDD